MAITLYQEQIPFSNKRLDKPISQNGSYSNPIIAPFAFDFTTYINVLESVIYVRNDSQEHYYKNIVISLMKSSETNDDLVNGTIINDPDKGCSISINGDIVPLSISSEITPEVPAEGIPLVLKYQADYTPIYEYKVSDSDIYASDDKVNVKFSYGYDELNEPDWDKANSSLLIPYIGTTNMPDTSYHPVRVRIIWKSRSPMLTIRDYFIDISYEQEVTLGA